MTDRTVPADPREALDPIVGYSTTDFAPTTEGTEVVGRFVFHDGHWWYAGKAARQDEPSPALRDLLETIDKDGDGLIPALSWALDLLDLCTDRLVDHGEPFAVVKGADYQRALIKARAALNKARAFVVGR